MEKLPTELIVIVCEYLTLGPQHTGPGLLGKRWVENLRVSCKHFLTIISPTNTAWPFFVSYLFNTVIPRGGIISEFNRISLARNIGTYKRHIAGKGKFLDDRTINITTMGTIRIRVDRVGSIRRFGYNIKKVSYADIGPFIDGSYYTVESNRLELRSVIPIHLNNGKKELVIARPHMAAIVTVWIPSRYNGLIKYSFSTPNMIHWYSLNNTPRTVCHLGDNYFTVDNKSNIFVFDTPGRSIILNKLLCQDATYWDR